MSKIKYSEKLKDPRWQKKRLEVFQRDNFTCQKCFDTDNTLTVHHRYYEKGKEPWEYPLESLVTLCQDCHQEEYENQYSSEADLIKYLRLAGFFNTDLDALSLIFYNESTQQGYHLCHTTEVFISVISWIIENESIQREMIDRYFEQITPPTQKNKVTE